MFQKMLIGGKLVGKDKDGSRIDVINPATEKLFARVPRGREKHIDRAVAAAREAFPKWAATPVGQRQAVLSKIADTIAANAEMLARLMVKEQGKPMPEALGEMAWTEGYLRHYATLSVKGRTIQSDDGLRIEMQRLPLGVVAGICPWNFPVLIPFWKIGPALVAGNTIVLKPAPTTPVTILKVLELCKDIVPAGVINAVTDENDLGACLTAHAGVDKVSFTGSSETGKRIMASAAGTVKRVTLELGGNDPAIVLPDVDVRAVAQKIYGGAFLNAGQVCMAIKRVYAHDSIYDEFCAELARLADAAIVGDGLHQGTTIGPVQNRTQFAKLRDLIRSAEQDGQVLSGGVIEDRKGFFIKPVIVRDVTDGDDIVDREQFGPILPVIRFSSVKDATARANASAYGLGASVWSADSGKAARVAAKIESGTVWVNQHANIGPHIPMAGCKASGLGVEQSAEGLEEYTQIRVLNVAR